VERIHSAEPPFSASSFSSDGKVEITGLSSAQSQPRNPQIIRVRLPLPP
jgi:hypothetical protein